MMRVSRIIHAAVCKQVHPCVSNQSDLSIGSNQTLIIARAAMGATTKQALVEI